MDRDFVEREYNNRARVPDHPQYFARWERDSKFVRATLAAKLDLAYGPDVRHRLDIFPATGTRGTLVFFHGGYWRSLDKDMFSWIAAPFVAAGIGVALPRYRLVPAATIEEIAADAVAATNWLFANGPMHGLAMDRVVVSGHSAGGHLAAALLATPRAELRFEASRIVGAVPISGVFDFEPLRHFSFNADFRLDAAAVARMDLTRRQPTVQARIVVAAGADETSEFRRQSRALAEAWSAQVKAFLLLPGANHFSIVDAFAERGQVLHDATVALF